MSNTRMTRTLEVIFGSVWLLVVLEGGALFAQEETTWFESLANNEIEVLPTNINVLSLSVSRLPLDDSGSALSPDGTRASGGLVPRGTAIYGTFEFADRIPDNLATLRASQIHHFVDDQELDLCPAVSFGRRRERKANASALVPRQTKVIGFMLTAPNPPSPDATGVKAAASLLFQSMLDERTEQHQLQISEAGALPSGVGPLRYTCTDVEGYTPTNPREQRLFASVKPKYRLILEPRQKPVKLIELLDEKGLVIDDGRYPGRPRGAWRGPLAQGTETSWLVAAGKTTPTTIRVTWFEQVTRIRVPIEVSASLGLAPTLQTTRTSQ